MVLALLQAGSPCAGQSVFCAWNDANVQAKRVSLEQTNEVRAWKEIMLPLKRG